jgi:hypothetical protein
VNFQARLSGVFDSTGHMTRLQILPGDLQGGAISGLFPANRSRVIMTRIAGLGFACVLAVAAMPAQAADSDAPVAIQHYPDPDCVKPEAKQINPNGFDASAVNSYNLRVRRYNTQLSAYNSCVHAYVDKANADIRRIQDAANSDMARIRDTANASMKEIEQKVRDAVAAANEEASETAAKR